MRRTEASRRNFPAVSCYQMRNGRIAALLLAVVVSACLGDGPTNPGNFGQAPGNPADARIVTSDIARFWTAFDAGATSSAFQTNYLNRASAGLADFMRARQVTAQSLAQMVQAFPQYFTAIRGNTLLLTENSAVVATIRANFETIETLYPPAVFPPVTFLIGRFSTGGTIRPSGMLVGTEFYASDANTPLHELGAFQRANVRTLESLPLIVAHEHVHVMQAVAGKLFVHSNQTLLEQSLLEGSADFIGELVSGGHVNTNAHAYGLAHESELWNEFKLVMNGTNVTQWLYNQGSPPAGHPGDLGYFIGYRIAQAYYDKAADKSAALSQIIEVNDAPAFLTASGYAP
jgi:hypothetical protein